MTSDDRHRAMEAARVRAELTVQELWLRYIALGGSSDDFDVDGYLPGMVSLDTLQQDVLAEAVNEGLEERYRSTAVDRGPPRRLVMRRRAGRAPGCAGARCARWTRRAASGPGTSRGPRRPGAPAW